MALKQLDVSNLLTARHWITTKILRAFVRKACIYHGLDDHAG
jgi:hypothetical protein